MLNKCVGDFDMSTINYLNIIERDNNCQGHFWWIMGRDLGIRKDMTKNNM